MSPGGPMADSGRLIGHSGPGISARGQVQGMTKTHYLSAAEIADRWQIHRSTVPRVLRQWGVNGIKLGAGRTAPRRFTLESILRVESAAHVPVSRPKPHASLPPVVK